MVATTALLTYGKHIREEPRTEREQTTRQQIDLQAGSYRCSESKFGKTFLEKHKGNMESMDWSALGFDYRKTDYNVRYTYTDGRWSEMVVTDDEYIRMHMSASCLHYGIELFEGLKAFRGVDGRVRLFRVHDNAERLRSSAERLCLPVPTVEMVVDACIEVVKRNEAYIPPYESGASLYLRPVMFGTTPGLGVRPAKDALLIVYCSPVGAYFKEASSRFRSQSTANKTALLHVEQAMSRSAAIMRRACCRDTMRTSEGTPTSSIWMPPSINTLRSAALQTFSASRRGNTSHRNRPPCCPPLRTKVCASWLATWV